MARNRHVRAFCPAFPRPWRLRPRTGSSILRAGASLLAPLVIAAPGLSAPDAGNLFSDPVRVVFERVASP